MTIAVSQQQLGKILSDVEVLLQDVGEIIDQDAIATERLAQVISHPEIGKSEQELDDYLRNRGVKID